MSDTEANSGMEGSQDMGADATDATKELLGDMTNAEAVMWYGLFSWTYIAVYHLFPILIKGLFAPGIDFNFISREGGKYEHMGLAWIWSWFFDGELIRTLYGATLGDTTLGVFGRW